MQTLEIDTTRGRVRGSESARARRWLGIPYAAPPVGPLRWMPPAEHPGWSGVRDALKAGPAALQHGSQMSDVLPGGLDACSEDCLTLNIFAPLTPADTPLPVMVWIHGGGFSIGCGGQETYAGDRLASAENVIIVTLNYRLGVLGFLNLDTVTGGAIPATGNEGLLDQVAALRWVADNIAAFGGDPENVTLFGESAGAMSIAALLAMPSATGLFHGAILQSGSAHVVHDPERAQRVGELFLDQLPGDVRRDPRRADAAALTAASRTLHGRMMFDERLTTMPTRPVVDGHVLPSVPIAAMRAGDANRVPLLIGSNRDEWRYFLPLDKGIMKLDHDRLLGRLRFHYDEAEVETLLARYDYDRGKPNGACDVYCEITGDAAFTMPSRIAARELAAHQPVFLYRFDHPAPGMGGMLGACHYSDVAYVFGTLGSTGSGVLFSDDPVSRDVSSRMQRVWANFARNGNTGDDNDNLAAWQPLNEASGCYHFAASDGYRNSPVDDRERFWSELGDERLQTL